jgi:hypothetical protein
MRAAAAAVVLASVCAAPSARAYRPFDGTDADVADPGAFELEIGPSQYYAQGGRHFLVAPATVLNLGLVPRLELVSDFRPTIALDRSPDVARVRVLETDVFLKWGAVPGALQGSQGPSLAFEGGPLLPEYRDDRTFGAQLDAILSFRVGEVTLHLNEQAAYTRAGNADWFTSVIVEGAPDHGVRPVAEAFFETGDQTVVSGLVGAIWAVSASLSLDTGLRTARVAGERASEIRLGLTWATPVWSSVSHVESAALR